MLVRAAQGAVQRDEALRPTVLLMGAPVEMRPPELSAPSVVAASREAFPNVCAELRPELDSMEPPRRYQGWSWMLDTR